MLGAVALLLAVASAAAAQEVSTQFWPEVDTFVHLNENMRIYVPVSRTRVGADNSFQDGTVGIYFDYFALPIARFRLSDPSRAASAHKSLARVGYYYTAGASGQPGTNTLEVEWTWRQTLPWKILAGDRNRFDLNFTGGDFDPRYRNRIRFERDFAVGRSFLTPYAYGEFFYSFNEGAWLKTRVAGGFELHVWERFVPEVYYQRDYGSGSRADVRGVGLVFSVYLR